MAARKAIQRVVPAACGSGGEALQPAVTGLGKQQTMRAPAVSGSGSKRPCSASGDHLQAGRSVAAIKNKESTTRP